MVFTPPQTPPNNPTIVTIWIHGTKVDECLPSPFAQLAKRIGNVIFQHHLGLQHASALNTYQYEAIRASILGTTCPILFPQEYFYSFGWSGKFNTIARKKASYDLFNHMKQLSYDILLKTGLAPEFIVIAHSHAGNVLLHMAEIQDPDGFQPVISRAILLACPVQRNTAHLINSPIFKRIYSLHSHTDMIQIIDMQGLRKKHHRRPFFSERHFQPHPKLVQACIRWKNGPTWHKEDQVIDRVILKHLTNSINFINLIKKNRGLFHVEFQLLPFIRHLGSIIKQLDELFEKEGHCPSHKNDDIIIEL